MEQWKNGVNMATRGSDLLQGLNDILLSQEIDRDRDRKFAKDIFKMQIEKSTQEQNTLIQLQFDKMNRLRTQLDKKQSSIEQLQFGDDYSRYALEELDKAGTYASGNAGTILGDINTPILEQLGSEVEILEDQLKTQSKKYTHAIKSANTYRAMGTAVLNTNTASFDGDPRTVSKDDLRIALTNEFESLQMGEYENTVFKPTEAAFDAISAMIVTDKAVNTANKSMIDYENGYGNEALLEKDIANLGTTLLDITAKVANTLYPVINPIKNAALAYHATTEKEKWVEGSEEDLNAKALLTNTKIGILAQFLPDKIKDILTNTSTEKNAVNQREIIYEQLLNASVQLVDGFSIWESSKDNKVGVNFGGIIQATESLISIMSAYTPKDEAGQLNEDIYNQLGFMGLNGFNKIKEAINKYDNYTAELLHIQLDDIGDLDYTSTLLTDFDPKFNYYQPPPVKPLSSDPLKIDNNINVDNEGWSESWWGNIQDNTKILHDSQSSGDLFGLEALYAANPQVNDARPISHTNQITIDLDNINNNSIADTSTSTKNTVIEALNKLDEKFNVTDEDIYGGITSVFNSVTGGVKNFIEKTKKENARVRKLAATQHFIKGGKHISDYKNRSDIVDRYFELENLLKDPLAEKDNLNYNIDHKKIKREIWYLTPHIVIKDVELKKFLQLNSLEEIEIQYDLFSKAASPDKLESLDAALHNWSKYAPEEFQNMSIPQKIYYLKKIGSDTKGLS